jgi:DNA-binding NarL/FixJ family response regulator
MPADTKPKQTRVRSGGLSPETQNAIIKALKDGESPSSIAAEYGISRTTQFQVIFTEP